MTRIISFVYLFISIFSPFAFCVPQVTSEANDEDETSEVKDEDFDKRAPLIEIDSASVQILDKISGKIFKKEIFVDQPVKFGTIKITLIKAYKNNPEDDKETYAFLTIQEHGKVIFNNWLFASSPAVNLMKHPVYDVRVEQQA